MIITDEIRQIVKTIESADTDSSPSIFKALIDLLHLNCKKPEVIKRYADYSELNDSENLDHNDSYNKFAKVGQYPIDNEGFAIGYDPIEDEAAFFECWNKYGFVVGKTVIPRTQCEKTIARIHQLAFALSAQAFSLEDPNTYAAMPIDPNNIPLISRGFFEIYHDASLAELRQALRIYIHHVILWGSAYLWTTFDRFGVKLAGHKESYGLPLHVDQNPLVHPNFKTIQGVLALTDCPFERGTYVGVPGSKILFHEYKKIVQDRDANYTGEYVELNQDAAVSKYLYDHAQPIPIRAGDLISWDSRNTHANSANFSGQARIVAYISAGPARWYDQNAVDARKEAFKTSLGSNVREALMHASMRPRFTDSERVLKVRESEKLNYLGERLYGTKKYEIVDESI